MTDTNPFVGNRAMLRWMREAARKDVADLSHAALNACGTDEFHSRNIDCAGAGEWPYEVLTVDQARAWANACGFPLAWCYLPEPPYPAEEHVGRQALMREQAGLCPMCGQPLRQEQQCGVCAGKGWIVDANSTKPPPHACKNCRGSGLVAWGQPLPKEEEEAAHLGVHATREVLAANPVEPPDVIGECAVPEIGGEV